MAELKKVDGGLEYTYTEPNTTKTGTPLTDLEKVEIWSNVDGGSDKLEKEVPASSPTGGQVVSTIIPDPIGPDNEGVVKAWSVAVDDDGNKADPGGEVTLPLDNLAPAPTL